MPLILNCEACGAPLTIARRHRGQKYPCPECQADLDIPRGLAFSGLAQDAAADRRRGHRLVVAAWLSGIVWFPVIPAIAYFIATRHIRVAHEDGRPIVGPLHTARLIAASALVGQCLYYGVALLGWPTFGWSTFGPNPFHYFR